MKNLLIALGAGALVPATVGFTIPNLPVVRTRLAPFAMQASSNEAPSYKERLQEAQAKRRPKSNFEPPPTTPTTSPIAEKSRTPAKEPRSDPVSPFSTEIQEELRVAINLLTARMQRDAPMSVDEFERFEQAVALIVEDALPQQELPSPKVEMPTPKVEMPPTPQSVASSKVEETVPTSQEDTEDDDESEGPAWDPTQGYGISPSTTNTYVIEGMGTMDADEYQEALREKVIKRAQEVRETGKYGNIVAKDYLKFLNKQPKVGDEIYKKEMGKERREKFKDY